MAAMDAAAKALKREVAIGHRVERIGRRSRKAERLRRGVAIDGEAGAGERRSTQGQFVEPCLRVGEPSPVAAEHLGISEKMMAEGDRLRGLQMGEARHHGRGVSERLLGERELQTCEQRID